MTYDACASPRDPAAAATEYRRQPTVLAIADSPAMAAEADRAIAAAGARPVAVLSPAEGLARLREPGMADAVLLAIGAADTEIEALLAGVADGVAARRFAAAASLPAERIDLGWALLAGSDAALLIGGGAAEQADALAQALAAHAGVRDRDEDEKARLARLSAEMARVARDLAALSQGAPAPPPGRDAVPAIGAPLVRALIRLRRMRAQFFEPALFADPAWDMLLDLTAARLEGRDVAVSSLCIAAAVPATTALRWIKAMTDQGLLVREADPDDRRRVHMRLSDAAAERMVAYLQAAVQTGTIRG